MLVGNAKNYNRMPSDCALNEVGGGEQYNSIKQIEHIQLLLNVS